jgi:hypothetical protein
MIVLRIETRNSPPMFVGMRTETRKLLLDVGWLVAKRNTGAGFDILSDFNEMEKPDIVLKFVGRAVGLSLNAAKIDPRQLPGQLVGTLLPATTPHPEVATFFDRLRQFDYGFQWWCPISPTWERSDRACSRVSEEHGHIVCSIACTKGNVKSRNVSGGNDKTVRIWDSTTGECELVLQGHSECVNAVAWSTDNSHIASASDDKTICLWDATTGDLERVLANDYAVYSIAISTGFKIVSGSLERITVWDWDSGKMELILKGHTQTFQSLSLLNGGPVCASGSDDGTNRIWNIGNGACIRVLTPGLSLDHGGQVNSVVWAPDERLAPPPPPWL